VSNKTRFFTIVFGVTALAGLTYGVTRRGLQRRAMLQPLQHQPLTHSQPAESDTDEGVALSAPDWETLNVSSGRPSNPDALDVAMNLDGLFDIEPEDGAALTVRPSDRVPAPVGGDDEEAPSADDLGRTWLAQATQAEHSTREADLTPELDEIALAGEVELDGAELDEIEAVEIEADEHEDFRRTRA
jgi:hypothetical protein